MDLQEIVVERRLDWSGSGYKQVAVFCESCNEHTGSL